MRALAPYALFLILIITFQGCNSAAESPYADIQWVEKATLPIAGLSSASVASIDDKAYITFGRTKFGANSSSGNHTNDCWEYNASNDTWTKKTACPGTPRVNAISTALNGKIYTGLGFHGTKYDDASYLKDFWMYDPQTDTWEQKADYPNHQTDGCISFVHEGKIYVAFGYYGTYIGNSLALYDPENDTWTHINNHYDLFRTVAVSCSNDEHIFMGTGFRTYNLNDWWEYFPTSDSWKKLKDMPDEGRFSAVALCVNDRFFVSTGRYFRGNQTGGHLKSEIIEYDVLRNVWYKRGNIPTQGRENAIAFTINGKGYIGLGEGENALLNDLWSFEP